LQLCRCRFLAEKVVHHPTIIAAVAEGRRWRYEGDAEVKSKFWGRSIELRPEGERRALPAWAGWLAAAGLAVLRMPSCAFDSSCSPLYASKPTRIGPAGLLRLTFADGDVYQWNKVTTSINNLILGKIYIDHGGIMKVRGAGLAS
jgi:hypothetical protein